MKNKIIIIITSCFLLVDALCLILCFSIVPIVLNRDVFVYELGSKVSNKISDYASGNETVLTNAKLNLKSVKDSIGTYPANISYQNKKYEFYIQVVDTTKPKVTLKSTTFNYIVDQNINPLDLIESVVDKSDVIAYFTDEDDQRRESLTYSKPGSHIVLIEVEDSSGNMTAKLRAKIVVTKTKINKPLMSGIEDKEIEKGDEFKVMDGVKATDGSGNDITSSIKVLKNDVNTKKVGTYNVIYYVTNSSGESTQRTRIIKVVRKKGDQ